MFAPVSKVCFTMKRESSFFRGYLVLVLFVTFSSDLYVIYLFLTFILKTSVASVFQTVTLSPCFMLPVDEDKVNVHCLRNRAHLIYR